MKHFLIYCIYCLIIPIIIVTINFVIDFRQFVNPHSSFIERLVNDLENNNLTYHMNVPERRIVKKRIEKTIKGTNNIVIGSSRVLMIGVKNGFNYVNLGVSGFSLEDMVHLYDLFNYNKVRIDTLIVGVDPWIFNKYSGDSRSLQFKQRITRDDVQRMFSIRYLYDNLRINKYNIWNGDTSQFTIFSDGSIRYGEEKRTQRWKSRDFILDYTEKKIYKLNNYSEIDPDYLIEFIRIVNLLEERSNHVMLFLPPYHPLVINDLLDKVPIIKFVESNLIEIFKDHSEIDIVGSFNPNLYNLDYNDFYDAMHLSESGIKKMFKMIR